MTLKGFRTTILLLSMILSSFSAIAGEKKDKEEARHFFQALGAPKERLVNVEWNRFNDHAGLTQILQKLNKAFPHLTRLYSIGKSYQGRDLWCLEVSNRQKGDPSHKPGMYIDGNIHGNEVQAGEVVAYTAWYLCESYGKVEKITQLLDDRVFYLIPTINPDGRDHWFHEANTPHSSRSGLVPLDEDYDGTADEDGYDDLDGDGSITFMWIKDPNGRWKPHPDYPEYIMIPVKPDERGEYTLLGYEGIDNDGDGLVNEDGPGGYDTNRNWAYDWQPSYIQYGAHQFPFSLPESRSVAEFVLSHPNIASAQSYHNNGGMILRSPGRKGGAMERGDDNILAAIGQKGERIIPYYRSMIIEKDLYTVWGGEVDWFYAGRGILTFTNELWTSQNMFRSGDTGDIAQAEFIRYLLQNQGVTKFHEYDHPQFGKIEIGGIHKEFDRVPPSFLLEEECHRNMSFTLYQAEQMPLLTFGDTQVEKIGKNLYRIWVEIRNAGMIPTRTAQDVKNHINRPDLVTLEGGQVKVLSAGRITDRFFKKVEAVKARPERLEIEFIPGLRSERAQFIVSGEGTATLRVDSLKGGRITKTIPLK